MARVSAALLICFAGAAVAFSPSSLPLRAGLRSASSPAACRLQATAASATESAAQTSGQAWLAKVQRPVTKAEIGAIQRQAAGLAGEELKSWLSVRGYSGELLEQVAKQAGQPAESFGAEWEKKLEEAAGLEEKAAIGAKKKADLDAQAADLQAKADGELAEAVTAAKAALDVATQEAESMGWVPVLGGAKQQAKADAHEAYGAAMAARETAETEANECVAGAEVLGASLKAEAAQVASLKAEANRIRMDQENAAAAAALAAARQVVESAEQALAASGPAKALAVLADGSDALQGLGLRPNARIGAGSLPGRLAGVLAAAEAQTNKPAAAAASGMSAGGDSQEMTRNAFIGGALLAAVGLGAYLAKAPAPAPQK